MPSFSTTFTHRTILFPSLINVGAAVTLWQMPLTGDMDYEFSQLYGLVGFWTSCRIAWMSVRKWQSSSLAWKLNLSLSVAVLTGVAAVLIVCGCSYERGMFWYVLLVIPLMVSGTGLGLFCARQVRGWLWLISLVAISLIVVLFELWYDVPITIYSVFWGYFHGPLYDEVVPITNQFMITQFSSVAAGLLLAFLGTAVRPSKWRYSLLIAVLFLPVGTRMAMAEGVRYTELKEILSSHYSGGSVHLYLDPRVDSMGASLLRRTSFEYDRVCDQMNVTRKPEVTIFVFRDARQKKAIFGAGETNFAKIWHNEIFVNAEDARDVIRHEIVHVIASQEDWPIWNIGLLEGLAVAVEWDEPYFTPHEWASALLTLNRIPPVQDWLSGTGFFAHHGRMSYVLSGSFVRFLIDTYGVEKIKTVYSGTEFEQVYGEPLNSLDEKWRAFIRQVPMRRDDIEWAGVLLQPGIFGRGCVHAIAELQNEAAGFIDSLHWGKARESYEKALLLDSNRSDVATALIKVLMMSGETHRARGLVDKWLKKDVYASRRAELLVLRGDLWLLEGVSDSATSVWMTALSQFGRIPSVYLACHMRLSSSTSQAHWRDLEKIITAATPAEKIAVLDRIIERSPELKVPRFWKGATLFAAGGAEDAIRVLSDSAAAFRDSVFELRRRLMIVESLLQLERYGETTVWLTGTEELCRRQIEVNRVRELHAYVHWLNGRSEWD